MKLDKKISFIRPETRAAFPYSNSIYIDEKVKTVIDAGAGSQAYHDIPVEDVELLLITHNHFDHVHGVSLFVNSDIMAGAEEAGTYKDPVIFLTHSGFDQWEKIMGKAKDKSYISTADLPEEVAAKPGFNKVNLAGCIKDRQVLQLGNTAVTALHIPGHSCGHYAFFFEKEGILFSADMDLAPFGPWYGGGNSNLDELIDSVNLLIDIDPGILVTSHRRVFNSENDNIKKLLRNYLAIVLRKEEKILAYLDQPRSINSIAELDFLYESAGRNALVIFWARMAVMRHLERLQKLGQIEKLDTGDYVRI